MLMTMAATMMMRTTNASLLTMRDPSCQASERGFFVSQMQTYAAPAT